MSGLRRMCEILGRWGQCNSVIMVFHVQYENQSITHLMYGDTEAGTLVLL